MRTNIDIDDELMEKAMMATGERTKRGAVEAALRKVVKIADQTAALEGLRGIGWDGDLDAMRKEWSPPEIEQDFDDKP